MKKLFKRYAKQIDQFLLPQSKDHEGALPYVMLGYLFFYFLPLLFANTSSYALLIAAASLIVFLILYFHIYWVHPKQRIFHISMMWLLGIAIMPVYFGGMSFIIYAAAMSCQLGKIKRSAIAVFLIVSATAIVSYFTLNQFITVLPLLFFILMIGPLNIYFVDLNRKKAALKLSHQEVREMAKTAERERIARDLHDRIGHTFSIITLKAELAAKLLDKDMDAAKKELNDLECLSRETLSQIRDVVTDYRKSNLQVELINAKLALETAGIEFSFSMGSEQLCAKTDTELSNILREAITNIIRHSNASRCEVSLVKTDKVFDLEISDDGKAILKEEGNGLKGMRERAQGLGGKFNISMGEFTKINILIPLETQR